MYNESRPEGSSTNNRFVRLTNKISAAAANTIVILQLCFALSFRNATKKQRVPRRKPKRAVVVTSTPNHPALAQIEFWMDPEEFLISYSRSKLAEALIRPTVRVEIRYRHSPRVVIATLSGNMLPSGDSCRLLRTA